MGQRCGYAAEITCSSGGRCGGTFSAGTFLAGDHQFTLAVTGAFKAAVAARVALQRLPDSVRLFLLVESKVTTGRTLCFSTQDRCRTHRSASEPCSSSTRQPSTSDLVDTRDAKPCTSSGPSRQFQAQAPVRRKGIRTWFGSWLFTEFRI